MAVVNGDQDRQVNDVSSDLSVSGLLTEGAVCLEESLPSQSVLSGNTSQTGLEMYLLSDSKYYQVKNQDCTYPRLDNVPGPGGW